MTDPISAAYEELQKHWRKFPENRKSDDPVEAYKAWAETVHSLFEKGDTDAGNKAAETVLIDELKTAYALIHPDDRDKLFGILFPADSDTNGLQQLAAARNLMNGIYSGGLPNVPQHYKGNVKRARVVGILMNPGRDDVLQDRTDENFSSYDVGHEILESGQDVSEKSPELNKRVMEQPTILQSLWDGNGSWTNWGDSHTIIKPVDDKNAVVDSWNGKRPAYRKAADGKYHWVKLDLESFCEIEFFPYQTPKWKDLPVYLKEKVDQLPSVRKARKLLGALAADTAEGIVDGRRDEHGRVFIVRNKDVLQFFRESIEAKHLSTLIDAGLVFTFSSDQSRSVSANNLRLVGIDEVEGGQVSSKQPKLNDLEWENYSFIERPFEVSAE
ncbi:hypothetical protein [Corynebacterium sp. LK2510]|uniref:hypothetical protein n=1 Tax=Corynebacterium sp. LK2510 TaxID=3110472 RepID=UPI0034CFCB01